MLEPFDWNVVVAGAWNRALLTPAWLQKRVFKQPDATLELFLPVEFPAPPRVKLREMTIEVSGTALIVGTEACTYETLGTAQKLATNALDALGETPIAGVGINVRYRLGALLEVTLQRTNAAFDKFLADSALNVKSRSFQRTIAWEAGELNLTLEEDEGAHGTVLFNFHLGTPDVAAAKEWLRTPADRLKSVVDLVLHDCIGIEKGGDDAN